MVYYSRDMKSVLFLIQNPCGGDGHFSHLISPTRLRRIFRKEPKMPRFVVNIAMRVWVETEVIAPTEEQAKDKARERADQLLNDHGFSWVDGKNEILGALNLSRLKKIPS